MRAVLLLAGSLALWSTVARASPAIWIWPTRESCTMPSTIPLVGASIAGRPDTVALVSVVIRDLGFNPWPYAELVLDFSAATDVAICPAQAPGLVVYVQSKTIEAVTDGAGVLRVAVLGRAIPGAPASAPGSVRVLFKTNSPPHWNIEVGRTSCCAFDLNGTDGLTGTDFGLWLKSFVSGANPPRADYDGDGMLGGADLTLWLRTFFNGGSVVTCPPVVTEPD